MPITARSPSSRIHSWSVVKRSKVIGISSCGSAAVVTVWDKGHGSDVRRTRHAAHEESEGRAFGGMSAIDITHRDRATDRGAEAAAGYLADLVARGVDDRGLFARRRAPIRPDSDALAGRFSCEFAQDNGDAGKAPFGDPPFSDRPGQVG